jgi:Tol biopolymer transport system component
MARIRTERTYTCSSSVARSRSLTHTNSGFVCCATWSPDGRQIAFGRCNDHGGAVFAVPTLGAPERKLTDVACTYGVGGLPEWTPDGKHLLLTDWCGPDRKGIVLFSIDTSEKKCLSDPPVGSVGDIFATLSPDKETVAFLQAPTDAVNDLYTLPLQGGTPRQITSDRKTIFVFMWSADGQHIIFRSNRQGLGRIWRASLSGAPVEPETRYPEVGSLSADGRLHANRRKLADYCLACRSLAGRRKGPESESGSLFSE